MKEVWGPRGPGDINISCKAGKAGLTIFRKAKLATFAILNGRGTNHGLSPDENLAVASRPETRARGQDRIRE